MKRVDIERAARRLGAQPEYLDWTRQRRKVGTATLAAVTTALSGGDPDTEAPAPIRPVVATGATPVEVGSAERAVLRCQDGSEIALPVDGASVTIPASTPVGVHHLLTERGRRPTERLVLRRPPPRPVPPWLVGTWGVFAAVHSLRSPETDRGVGTLSDLDRLGEVLSPWRPRLLSVLPLFAIDANDPSPYSPVSQHFWNEAHLDLDRLCDALGVDRPEPGTGTGPMVAGRADLVDWPAVTAQVHHHLDRILDHLGGTDPATVLACPDSAPGRNSDSWSGGRPGFDHLDPAELRAYCAFRGGDRRARHRHRLAQVAMEHQLAELSASLQRRGQALALDLPIGTSANGFDLTNQPDLFLDNWSIGAPPDEFFRLGQRWGLPPVNPVVAAANGHDYLGRSVAALARHAGAIRVDHVMGLERLWWVPPGAEADEGVYVTQPTEELAARLAIEIHRTGTAIIGENLGTVPPTTAALLVDEGMLGMYEELFAVGGLSEGRDLPEIPADVAAGTGTHDMPTFAGFVAGADIALVEKFQGMAADDVAELAAARRRDVAAWSAQLGVPPRAPALLAATLDRLSRSAAAHVVVSLDDLWLEPDPLNVPGTSKEVPNWRRRTRLDLPQMARSPSVRRYLDTVADRRRADDPTR
jgi:4-alpha-glucanotransferase